MTLSGPKWIMNFWWRHQNICHKNQTKCFPKDSHGKIWARIECVAFLLTTEVEQNQSPKIWYKPRSKYSIIISFDPLDPTLFSGVKIQSLTEITISYVWTVLCRLLSVFTSTLEVAENMDSKAMSLIHCLLLCELGHIFLKFPVLQFLHLWNRNKLASVSWGQWINMQSL